MQACPASATPDRFPPCVGAIRGASQIDVECAHGVVKHARGIVSQGCGAVVVRSGESGGGKCLHKGGVALRGPFLGTSSGFARGGQCRIRTGQQCHRITLGALGRLQCGLQCAGFALRGFERCGHDVGSRESSGTCALAARHSPSS
jgi:hypothetical protein